jgi:hypothetical protein
VGRHPGVQRASRPRPAAAAGTLISGFLSLGLLAACDAARDAPPVAGPVPRADAPAALAERLPASAAGFQRGATVPVAQPRPGTEVNYATEGRRAAAFVQVLRPEGAAPADGPQEAEAQAEFQRWVTESARGQGPARRLSVAAEFQEPPSAPLLRCAAMEGSYGRQPVQSLVCVGAAGGQILRIRASMPRHTPPVADPRAFVREIAAALRGTPVEPGEPMPPPSAAAPMAAPAPEAMTEPAPAGPPAARRGAPARAGAASLRPPARQASQPARAAGPARAAPQPARAAPRAGTTGQRPAPR